MVKQQRKVHTSKFNIKNDTLFTKKITTILSILFVSAISFTSCKGSAGKKAAIEIKMSIPNHIPAR